MLIFKLSQLEESDVINHTISMKKIYKRLYKPVPYFLIIDNTTLEFEWYDGKILDLNGCEIGCERVKSCKHIVFIPDKKYL